MSFVPDPNNIGLNASAASISFGQTNNDVAIDQLNSLLRGEISAAETYAMAIKRCNEGDNRSRGCDAQTLRNIQEEHGRACQSLRTRIRELGGKPSDSSGAWGAWAKTVEGTASLFGDRAGLKALKEGEEHGLKDYQEAIDDVDAASASYFENDLIPSQQRHVMQLEMMMASIHSA